MPSLRPASLSDGPRVPTAASACCCTSVGYLNERASVGGRRVAYVYFYCLGQKNQARTGCREASVPADLLETAVERLYE